MTLDRSPPYTLLLSFPLVIETLLRAGEAEAAALLLRFGEHVGDNPGELETA